MVAPTSVVPNWRAETARFAPELRVHVSHGLKRKEAVRRSSPVRDLVLTTYPLLARDKDALLAQEFHLVILDEAQQIKNAKTQAAKVVQQLKARHRLCLTGTPIENHLGELWSLFHFLMPGLLGDADAFRRLYRTPIEKQRRRAAAAEPGAAHPAVPAAPHQGGGGHRAAAQDRDRARRSSWETRSATSTRPCAPPWTSGYAPRSPRAGWPRARSWCSTRCSSCARSAATRACSSSTPRKR